MDHLNDIYDPARVEVECEISKLLNILKEQHQLSNVYFHDLSEVALRLESGDYFYLKHEYMPRAVGVFFQTAIVGTPYR